MASQFRHTRCEVTSQTQWLPLSEIPAPADLDPDAICPLPGHSSRVIWAEGNPAGPVMLVLDNPGAREDRDGNPFVCGTRQTLRSASLEAGLHLHDLYVTWILKRRPVRAYAKQATRAAAPPYLQRQIQEGGARVIVLLGNVVLQSVLGDPTLEVKALRGQELSYAGLPAVASYHPLAARRRPNLLPYLVEDLRRATAVALPPLSF